MKDAKEKAKKKIYDAAQKLLSSTEDIETITTRQIALEADVNLALINYYYQSKDNLLNLVGMSMMQNIIDDMYDKKNEHVDPVERLKDLLLSTADFAFKHHKIFKIVINIDIKQGCKNSCDMILPMLKEIFVNENKSELDIIALQLLLPFHNIVANPEIYNDYFNTDFFDDEKRRKIINEMIESILKIRGN